jgi:16S rRNA (uracil1498-N3)-methyltransferase
MLDAAVPRAPRIYCEGALSPGAVVELSDRAARHVAALRLGAGDAVTLFNGDGTESAAVLTGVGRRGTVAAVRERRAVDRESPLAVHLAQGVCASDRMDLVLQKATELGVVAIQPVVAARSIVRLSSERRERRETHWQNVVVAACEQCGRNRVPPVAPSVSFGDFLAGLERVGTLVVLSPEGETTVRSLAPRPPVTLLIGPEGGLAPEERALAAAAGFMPVRFGPRILRTETAPLAALAALQAIYGDC